MTASQGELATNVNIQSHHQAQKLRAILEERPINSEKFEAVINSLLATSEGEAELSTIVFEYILQLERVVSVNVHVRMLKILELLVLTNIAHIKSKEGVSLFLAIFC
jgi:hypothetical protein